MNTTTRKSVHELVGAIAFYASDRADDYQHGMTPEARLAAIQAELVAAGYDYDTINGDAAKS